MLLKVLGAISLFASVSAFASGPGSSGGGDATEMGVDQIRADILKWIDDSGAKGLKFPSYLTYDAYVGSMSTYLKPHAVVVSFVTTAQEAVTQDPEQQVIVDGVRKSCRNFWSTHDHMPHILCNTERYPKAGADQYRLIHHEFAGLAGVERNVDASSDYFVSEQLTEFLTPETFLRLGIKRLSPGQSAYLGCPNLNGKYQYTWLGEARISEIKQAGCKTMTLIYKEGADTYNLDGSQTIQSTHGENWISGHITDDTIMLTDISFSVTSSSTVLSDGTVMPTVVGKPVPSSIQYETFSLNEDRDLVIVVKNIHDYTKGDSSAVINTVIAKRIP